MGKIASVTEGIGANVGCDVCVIGKGDEVGEQLTLSITNIKLVITYFLNIKFKNI